MTPCPRCLDLYERHKIWGAMVQPLPKGARAPLAIDGSGKCCQDCASADTLIKFKHVPFAHPSSPDFASSFEMARIAVGNDRADSLRAPGVRLGLVAMGFVRPSAAGDLKRHYAWLDEHHIEPGEKPRPGLSWESPEIKQQFPYAGADWDVFATKRKISSHPVAIAIEFNGIRSYLRATIFDEDDYEIDSFCYRPIHHHPFNDEKPSKLIPRRRWEKMP